MDRDKEKQELRKSRLRALRQILQESGDTHQELADKVDTPSNYVSQLFRDDRAVGDELAARIEKAYRKPAGWMDRQRDEVKPGKAPIAQQNFLEEDLAVLKQLTALPDDMREAISDVIAAAYASTRPKIGKAARRAKEPQPT